MSWQAQVKETEVPEADECNSITGGSHDCEQDSKLPSKIVNAVTNASPCMRMKILVSALVCFVALVLGLQ